MVEGLEVVMVKCADRIAQLRADRQSARVLTNCARSPSGEGPDSLLGEEYELALVDYRSAGSVVPNRKRHRKEIAVVLRIRVQDFIHGARADIGSQESGRHNPG